MTTDIYGLKTDNGQPVVYQDAQGRLVPGVVKNLWPPIYKADLEVRYPDGTTRFVEGAVFNDGPAAGGWKHDQVAAAPTPDQAPADQGDQAAASSSSSTDPGDQAAAAPAKKRGK